MNKNDHIRQFIPVTMLQKSLKEMWDNIYKELLSEFYMQFNSTFFCEKYAQRDW